MSGKIVGEVMRYAPADLTPRERFVLVALAESARDNGPAARVSRTNADAVAASTGYAVGSVHNALSELARRCLIYPMRSKARRGQAQDYRLAQLEAHHRATVVRPAKASSPDEADGHPATNGKPHPPMSQSPVDNSAGDQGKPHRSDPNASSPDEAPRKDTPVTTVGRYLSRQEPRARDPKSGAPSPLRSAAIEAPTAPTPWSRERVHEPA